MELKYGEENPHSTSRTRRPAVTYMIAALVLASLTVAAVVFNSGTGTALAAQENRSTIQLASAAGLSGEPATTGTTEVLAQTAVATRPIRPQTYHPSLTDFKPFQPPDGWSVVGEYRLNQVAPDSPAEYNQTLELANDRGGRVAVSVVRDEMSTADPSHMFGPNFEKRQLPDGREAWSAGDAAYGTAVMVVLLDDPNTTMVFNGLRSADVQDLLELAGRVFPEDELTACSRQSVAPECSPGFVSVGEVTR